MILYRYDDKSNRETVEQTPLQQHNFEKKFNKSDDHISQGVRESVN